MEVREHRRSRLVVVGHGPTGHRLVEAVRERDVADGWHITVVGEDLVALTSYLTDDAELGYPSHDDEVILIFRTFDGDLYALSNHDPFSGANVLARGILGTRGGTPTVASPMYKQVFDLRSGQCLDDPAQAVPTYPVRRTGNGAGDRMEVALP
jgi:NAD(P)H-dependent nitrite reductase small subunit